MSDIKKICNRCNTERNENEFYTYTYGLKKSICKYCEKIASTTLWTCDICMITIRKKHRRYMKTVMFI